MNGERGTGNGEQGSEKNPGRKSKVERRRSIK